MEIPSLMLHGPDSEQQPASDPGNPGQLSQGHGAALHGGEVVHHGYGQHGVEGLIAEREAQVVTCHHLELGLL